MGVKLVFELKQIVLKIIAAEKNIAVLFQKYSTIDYRYSYAVIHVFEEQ